MTGIGLLSEFRALANPANLAGMARFGICVDNALGVTVTQIRVFARRIGPNQRMAEELWVTGVREMRILASIVADPMATGKATMDRWARDFNSWDVCDACCCNLFDRTPHAWAKVRKWAPSNREFVRRAAFATLAGLAVHDKRAPDRLFLDVLPLIEDYAFDGRNFVKKAVNWALRSIGKRNELLRGAAMRCAGRVREQNTPHARWIASDALRELQRARR